ncbi:DUF2569 family protein [Devosia sp.]|uniref:DUF2569 family protein n=1 Tax=Devosia sp. TaxID=1871048 RepID=UPI002FC651CD
MSDIAQSTPEARRFKGFFGWLLLPLLVLVGTPMLGATSLIDVLELLPLWPQRTMVQNTLFTYTVVTGFLLAIVAPIYLLTLLFRKKRSFLLLFGLWFALAVLHLLLGELLSWAVYRWPPFETRILVVAGVQAFVAFLWIRTTQTSERLKNTFVN